MGIICVILAASLIGTIENNTSIINEKDKTIAELNSRNIGIISVDPEKAIEIIRLPKRSGITQRELKEKVIGKFVKNEKKDKRKELSDASDYFFH